MEKGKLTVLLMIALALVMGAIAWQYRRHEGQRVLAAYGGYARIMRHAPHTALLLLGEPSAVTDTDEQLVIDGITYPVIKRRDLSNYPGLVHARHALIEDHSYDWTPRDPGPNRHWDFALQFEDGSQTATVAFDLSSRIVHLVETERELSIQPDLKTAYDKKLREWSR